MNFVPKDRSKAVINQIIEERQERKRKEIEELARECENSE